MNKFLLSIFLLFSSNQLFARRGGGRYHGPMPSGDDVVQYTFVGIVLAVILWIILKNNKEDNNILSNIGCGLMIAILICAIPLLIWLEVILNSLLAAGAIVFVAVVVVGLIINAFKKQ